MLLLHRAGRVVKGDGRFAEFQAAPKDVDIMVHPPLQQMPSLFAAASSCRRAKPLTLFLRRELFQLLRMCYVHVLKQNKKIINLNYRWM